MITGINPNIMRGYLLKFLVTLILVQNIFTSTTKATTIGLLPRVAPIGMKELLVNVYVNGIDTNKIFYILQDKEDNLWISTKSLEALNFNIPIKDFFYVENNPYCKLDLLKELKYRLDTQSLALYLTANPASFPSTVINAYQFQTEAIRPQNTGGFFNYDLFVEHDQVNKLNNISELSEIAYFNHYGIGTTNVLFQRVRNNQFPGLGDDHHIIRLDSTWTLDQPEKMATWRFGDSVTRPAEWSNSVHFAGIQYSTNFATQPGFIRFPTPAFRGEAFVPTTVDIIVNNATALNTQINSGPFYIPNVPVITGAGTAVITTRNILGQETITALPYYTSQGLLKNGLVDFSYEAGLIRNNYGINSFNYSRAAVVGTYRRGISNKLTSGWHAEVLDDQQTLGLSSDYLIHDYGILSGAIAGSHSRLGQGALAQVGFQRQTLLNNYGINITGTSKNYSELGINRGQFAPKLLLQAFYGITPPNFGSLTMGYILQEDRQTIPAYPFTILTPRETNSSLVTISYNRNLFDKLYFLASGLIDTNHSHNNQVLISFIWSFKDNVTASISEDHQTQAHGETLDITKNLPFGTGYGYRLHASTGKNDSLEADLGYQNNYGTYTGKIARAYGTTNYQVEAQGGIVRFGGKLSFSREIQQSFALVKVPGISNVAIYNRNQVVGYTDKYGELFIPYLLPYEVNTIRIDPKDLPLNMQIDQDQKQVIPYFRSGVLVKFPVKRIRSVMFNLLSENNHPIPTGVTVFINKSEYFVGDNGQVYIADLPLQKTIRGIAKWDDQSCYFTFTPPVTHDPLPDIGDILCRH